MKLLIIISLISHLLILQNTLKVKATKINLKQALTNKIKTAAMEQMHWIADKRTLNLDQLSFVKQFTDKFQKMILEHKNRFKLIKNVKTGIDEKKDMG